MRSSKSVNPTSRSSRAFREASGPAVSRPKAWLMAARPQTLPAGSVPVIVGTAAAWGDGQFRPLVFLAALAASLLIQIGTNLANDLFDFKKGADTEERLGPTRVTQAGLLTPEDVAKGMAVTFGLAFAILPGLRRGLAHPAHRRGQHHRRHSVHRRTLALGYHGLGDCSFSSSSALSRMGTYYLHTGQVTLHALLASLPVGCLATALLVVNNLRDIETDRKAGKRTLAVRLGAPATRVEYLLCVTIPFLVPFALWRGGYVSSFFWLPWLSLPLAAMLICAVFGAARGRALNPVLKRTGLLQLFYGLLFAGSYLL